MKNPEVLTRIVRKVVSTAAGRTEISHILRIVVQ